MPWKYAFELGAFMHTQDGSLVPTNRENILAELEKYGNVAGGYNVGEYLFQPKNPLFLLRRGRKFLERFRGVKVISLRVEIAGIPLPYGYYEGPEYLTTPAEVERRFGKPLESK